MLNLLFFFLSIFSYSALASSIKVTVGDLNALSVCDSCEIKQIKEAIKRAKPGAVIHIQAGMYKEGEIIIEKPLSLIADGDVILDGDNNSQIVTVKKADGVIIIGLTFQNTGISYTQELAGLRIIESKNTVIRKNKFLNTTYGVYLENSEKVQVADNEFRGQAKDESSGGNAIHLWYGSGHLIEQNRISGHRDGIYLEFSTDNQIRNNDVRSNIRYGLHFMFSHRSEYQKNYFSNNGAGVAVMYSHDIKMFENRFVSNTGPASYGLLLKDISASEIYQNDFIDNTVAIYMEGSNRSSFYNNVISANGWALRIMGNCENNEFIRNDFTGNTFDVTTNTNNSWNTFKENFWSQYDGYDLNRDGIGDKPYRPVSLSSVILERVESSYILMNSFFFSLIDQVERVLPTLTPEPLKDEYPLMTRANGVAQ